MVQLKISAKINYMHVNVNSKTSDKLNTRLQIKCIAK